MHSNENSRLVELINNGPSVTWGFFHRKRDIQRALKTDLNLIAHNGSYQYFKIFDNHGRPWVARWSKFSGHLIGALIREKKIKRCL